MRKVQLYVHHSRLNVRKQFFLHAVLSMYGTVYRQSAQILVHLHLPVLGFLFLTLILVNF